MARMMLMAELNEPRKSQQTSEVRRAERMSVNTSSWVDSRMNWVLSNISLRRRPSGKVFWASAMPFLHFGRHGHGVGAALFLNAQPHARLPPTPHDAPDVRQTFFHIGHVADAVGAPNGRAAARGDDDVLEFLDGARLAHDPHVGLRLARSRCARRALPRAEIQSPPAHRPP